MTKVETLPEAIWSGEFRLYGVTLHCHTLNNGQRVIDAADVEAVFRAMGDDVKVSLADADEILRFAKWRNGQ